MHSKDFKLNEETQSIEQLWNSLYRFTKRRVEDNSWSESYPLGTREVQMHDLRALVKAIEETHKKMRQVANK